MNSFLNKIKTVSLFVLGFFVIGYVVNSFFVVFPDLSYGVDFYLEYMDYLIVFAVIVLIAYSIYSSNKRGFEDTQDYCDNSNKESK